MKRTLIIASLLIFGFDASAGELQANRIELELTDSGSAQFGIGAEEASGTINIYREIPGCFNSVTRRNCLGNILTIPVQLRGLRLGAGAGISQQFTTIGSKTILSNWDGKSVYDLFGRYFGVNALQLDFLLFGVRGIEAGGMNSSRVVALKFLSGWAGNGNGIQVNLLSLRTFSVWPANSPLHAKTVEDYRNIRLVNVPN